MTVITVTDEQKAALLANGDLFAIQDTKGQLVMMAYAGGRPATPAETAELIGPGKKWTVEELDRRVQAGRWHTTAEVLEHLRGLTK